MNHRYSVSNVIENFEKIRRTLNLSIPTWCEVIGTKESQYKSLVKLPNRLSIESVMAVSQQYNLNIEQLLNGEIDLLALSHHFSGNHHFIPDRYNVAAFSRKRTVLNNLEYLQEKIDWNARHHLLKKMQISEASLHDEKENINLRFFEDFYTITKQDFGFTEKDFVAIGQRTVSRFLDAPIAQEFRSCRTLLEVYGRLVGDLLNLYEKHNCFYKITKVSGTKITIHVTSNPDVASAFGVKHIGSASVCQFKLGVFGATPLYLHRKLPMAATKKLECEHWGDKACIFEIDFSLPAFELRQLSFEPIHSHCQ